MARTAGIRGLPGGRELVDAEQSRLEAQVRQMSLQNKLTKEQTRMAQSELERMKLEMEGQEWTNKIAGEQAMAAELSGSLGAPSPMEQPYPTLGGGWFQMEGDQGPTIFEGGVADGQSWGPHGDQPLVDPYQQNIGPPPFAQQDYMGPPSASQQFRHVAAGVGGEMDPMERADLNAALTRAVPEMDEMYGRPRRESAREKYDEWVEMMEARSEAMPTRGRGRTQQDMEDLANLQHRLAKERMGEATKQYGRRVDLRTKANFDNWAKKLVIERGHSWEDFKRKTEVDVQKPRISELAKVADNTMLPESMRNEAETRMNGIIDEIMEKVEATKPRAEAPSGGAQLIEMPDGTLEVKGDWQQLSTEDKRRLLEYQRGR
jgi:hypothetical protein